MNMTRDQKYFQALLKQALHLDYAPGEGQEMVWAECLALIHQTGDRAARLGLAQIVTKARKHKWMALPSQAQALIAECLAAVTPEETAKPDVLNLKQAAEYLGYSQDGLRKIIHRTRRARSGRPVNGPTIEFSQPGKGACIRFRREWLDDFIDRQRLIPASPVVPRPRRARGPSHGFDY